MGCKQSKIDKKLNKLNKKNVKKFTLDGIETRAKIIKVYDGDSVHAIFPVHGEYFVWVCRLARIDSPELSSKDQLEKESAIKSRDKLRLLIFDKNVTIKCGKHDKYGRILVEIYHNGININDRMVELKLAVNYDGGKKQKYIVNQ